ncbi:DEAD/DEAH box helicase [Protofrankia symbiont of Coriaria ruscifolia]|uniref:DEAD/DEAH box helicase n=1 Tax=Protofrankia symbiont of Coriaria ruscifolia TaxID=1306542 RepID=UPI001041AF1A|nr:DEAD/DEAH box helicase [Protofrankia symbiont of Coriaria ruscifolia]
MSAGPLGNASASSANRRPLRAWQEAALAVYRARAGVGARDFLAVATPGAGKTTFALCVASDLLREGVVRAVTVVAPTEHLKRQWADAAALSGIALDPDFRNTAGATSSDYTGVVLTYAQVAAHPALHRLRCERRRTLVILDEIHHAGDALSWGDAVREAFTPATRRLALTGTPFRSDVNPIPFVTYLPGPDGVTRSVADSSYGYSDALRDAVVRPVLFLAYSGEMTWRTSAGHELSARLGEPLNNEQTAAAWRTALDARGDWIPAVLAAADTRLSQVRAGGVPDAGGLVIATDHANARAYAGILRRVGGTEPVVVLSDDPSASSKIAAFRESRGRWMVAVRMVSEGVDIPRLAVGVYATSVATPLFFAQAVGRFVRGRGRAETASVFLPSVPTLLALAGEMEIQRDHALDKPLREPDAFDDAALREANRRRDIPDLPEQSFTALGSSAHLDRIIFDGGEFGTQAAAGSAEEEDFLGLPGLLEPDQVAVLLKQREAAQLAARRKQERGEARGVSSGRTAQGASGQAVPAARAAAEEGLDADSAESRPTHEVIAELRRELNRLVAAHHHRTGRSHGMIHGELRRTCGGPATAQASAAQLRARIDTVRRWEKPNHG